MRPIQDIDKGTLSGIKFICTDIDDTLTRDGKLKPEAYQALWSLHDADLKVIPVTGRPAGWCDLIARQWPVDAVVGENGAFAFYLEDSFLNHMYFPAIASQESGRRLDELLDVIRKEIPECRVSKDQFSRKFDLAIDFCEEPPDLGFETAQRIAALCELHGATAKISSIHVNAW
ncbi:MAG: HAD-IIB family hydrolase, partial [Spirochaetales bacterium]|nr:HAD-IIB family hydrolase [Spirochaetales bacterium]